MATANVAKHKVNRDDEYKEACEEHPLWSGLSFKLGGLRKQATGKVPSNFLSLSLPSASRALGHTARVLVGLTTTFPFVPLTFGVRPQERLGVRDGR